MYFHALVALTISLSALTFKLHAADSFEVTFFNVGQGNCTLVKCPKGPPLLMDGGSAACPGTTQAEKNSHKQQTISLLDRKIAEYMPARGSSLNIVISHGDSDHYNWVKPVVDALKKKTIKPKIRFLLGGKQSDYNAEFVTYINAYMPKSSKKIFVSEYNNLVDIPSLNCGEAECKILAAESSNDKNENSIVLRLFYHPYSLLLTGDATGETTDGIITKNNTPGSLVSTILQASHHGADSEESNNDAWLSAVQPKFMIFSAGLRADYLHPKAEIAKRIIQIGSLQTGLPSHSIQLYRQLPLSKYHKRFLTNSTFKPYAFKKSGYFLAMTTLGLFTTSTQGHITLFWKLNGNIKYKFNGPVDKPIEEVRNHLKTSSSEDPEQAVFPTDPLIGLNLKGFEINDSHWNNDLHPYIPTFIISLSLKNNLLTDPNKYLEHMVKTSHTSLRDLNLKNTVIDTAIIVEIQKGWSNRGLAIS